jgi:hypothetical protein
LKKTTYLYRNINKCEKIKAKFDCKCANSGAAIKKGDYCNYSKGKVY